MPIFDIPSNRLVDLSDADLRELIARLSDRYVSRLLRLAWLAPEVLERLVVHREPSTISIYDLCFVASLPWEEQPGRVFD